MRAFDSLRGRREFTLVIRRGMPVPSEALTVYGFAPRSSARPKLGIVIPKTVGKAVRRNTLRRRCKAILERLHWPPPHRWYVVACKPGAAGLSFSELKRNLMNALTVVQSTRPAVAQRGRR